MRNNDGCGVALLALLAIPVVVIVSSIANGFALSVLWGWFVVPIFGLPALTIAQAIGFSMVVSFLTYQYDDSKKKEDDRSLTERIIYLLLMAILRLVIVLAVGAVVHLFV
jgi:peptidoglycan biosynthesis protein MviN/MurJ (putative lipid II flippase)